MLKAKSLPTDPSQREYEGCGFFPPLRGLARSSRHVEPKPEEDKNGRSGPRYSHSVHRQEATQEPDGCREEAARAVDGVGRQGQEQGGKGSFQANRKDNARNGKRRGKAVAGHGGECSR